MAEDTRDGVRVTLEVRPNPELRGVVVNGANALPARVIQDAFQAQYARTLNFGAFNSALRSLNAWYEERGIFGSVVDAELSEGGVCELRVKEAEVARVTVRTLDRASGEPVAAGPLPAHAAACSGLASCTLPWMAPPLLRVFCTLMLRLVLYGSLPTQGSTWLTRNSFSTLPISTDAASFWLRPNRFFCV